MLTEEIRSDDNIEASPSVAILPSSSLRHRIQLEEDLHSWCVIVGLSAHAMSGDRERYMAEGMVDYLTKPIRTDALQEVLDTCRQRKAAGKQ